MLDYILIGLSLVLLGVVGLQFTYMFYLDRLDRERKKHLRHLERRNLSLAGQLEAANRRIAEHTAVIEKIYPDSVLEDESWADVIEDR